MKDKIMQSIQKRTVKQFAAFFGLAFVFLVFSKLSNDYRQELQIKVNLINQQKDVVLKADSLNTVTAVVEAKGFSLLPLLFKNRLSLTIDAKTDVEQTDEAFSFNVAKNRYLFEQELGESFIVRSLKPEVLTMPYSKLASKKVPLQLVSKVTYDLGYDLLGEFKLSADSITVVGSEEAIQAIKVLKTAPLELKNRNTNIEAQLAVDIAAYKGIDVFPKSITVVGETARFTEGTIEVPVFVTKKPEKVKITVFPKSVSVAYYVALSQYKEISPGDFIVECEYPKDVSKVSYLVPKITKMPKAVKRATIRQNRIDFIIL